MKVYIKKSFSILLICVCVVALCVFTASCAEPDQSTKTITLVVGEGDSRKVFDDYQTDGAYLIDVLDQLQEADKLTYTTQDSKQGAYLTEINGISEPSDNSYSYLAILTTVIEYQDTAEWKVERVYNQTAYVSSIVGISDLKIVDGAGYMIVLV